MKQSSEDFGLIVDGQTLKLLSESSKNTLIFTNVSLELEPFASLIQIQIVYSSRISDQHLLCCSSVLQTLSTAEKWNCENNENIIRETSNCSHRRWGKWCVNVTGYKIIYINEVTVRLFVCLSVANALPLLNANYWRAQILLSVRNTITFID